jgi:hypothetical protein
VRTDWAGGAGGGEHCLDLIDIEAGAIEQVQRAFGIFAA